MINENGPENSGLPFSIEVLNISLGNLLLIMAAAFGCLNYVNDFVCKAITANGKLPADVSRTIDNIFLPLCALDPENIRTNVVEDLEPVFGSGTANDPFCLSATVHETNLPSPMQEMAGVEGQWVNMNTRMSPNIGALFVSQTMLRSDPDKEIYFISQKFPAGNTRNVDLSRVFTADDMNKDGNRGILATLLGLATIAFRDLSIYAFSYIVWPFTILCASTSMPEIAEFGIPVRTPFAHAQKASNQTECEVVVTGDVDIEHAAALVDLLCMVRLDCVYDTFE